MNIHANKTQDSKNHVVTNKMPQKQNSSQNGEPAFQFVDNRPETTTQIQLQKMTLNSPHANQALQLKTIANSQAESPIQKQGIEEEELLQGKFLTVQKQPLEEEELLQGKFKPVQKKGLEEEELLQGNFHTVQKQGIEEEELLQGKFEPVQKQENDTGLPDNLKSGIESLSGLTMDDVQVHFNSDKPESMQAHAYAQGTDIHLAPGQEKHLPHEAWHVVQQKQGRVKPTMQLQGKVNVNDDKGLEKEADVMGGKALQFTTNRIVSDTLRKVQNRTNVNQLRASQKLADNISSKPIQMGRGKHHERGEFDLYNQYKDEIKAENPDLPYTSPEIARLAAERFRAQYGEPDKKNKIGK
ncbi:DUF4157 domain-containing protein [Mariniphaga sp.]|uniref:eCIS core domain-containing protein n=1 Tax=Mariniphaga sp. TaxID=1954475 RepID=UPI003569AEFE